MKAVIVGAGNVGVFLAEDLRAAGHDITVLEQDPRLVASLSKTYPDVRWVAGDGCEYSTLDHVGLAEADVVVAATGDDEDNLVVALLAKQEFAVPRVVGRVNHPKNEWMFNQTWGVDVAVSTPHLLSAVVEEAVSVGSLVRLLRLDASGVRLVEVTLSGTSAARGRDLASLGMPRDATVVAIVRRSNVVVPRGDTRVEAGDEILVLVSPEAEDQVRRLLTGAEGVPAP
ncbi:MAG: TrkA family potassium uptake protein [Actinomycetota bacterium]|jgi:trk system potassium uptake protein TrkA|nr:TrkA family potassium uptake protein [Actinomycetota bacterium]